MSPIPSNVAELVGRTPIVQGIRGGWQPDDEKEVPIDWKAFGFVVAGLIANVSLIGTLGFSLASTVLFVLTLVAREPSENVFFSTLGAIVVAAMFKGIVR